jgi:hypothetical protein
MCGTRLHRLIAAGCAACGVTLAAAAGADPVSPDIAADGARAGIWKAVVPPAGSMRGEFDNHDPVGLAAGARITADCSINWVDPDGGRLYCFSSATSLTFFLEAPEAYLARARAAWRHLGGVP